MTGTWIEILTVASAIGESEVYVLATRDERIELSADPDAYFIRSNHSDDGPAYMGGIRCETVEETVACLEAHGVTENTQWAVFDV
jgi:hypothetical protein